MNWNFNDSFHAWIERYSISWWFLLSSLHSLIFFLWIFFRNAFNRSWSMMLVGDFFAEWSHFSISRNFSFRPFWLVWLLVSEVLDNQAADHKAADHKVVADHNPNRLETDKTFAQTLDPSETDHITNFSSLFKFHIFWRLNIS